MWLRADCSLRCQATEYSAMVLGRNTLTLTGVCKWENAYADHYRDYDTAGWWSLFYGLGPLVCQSNHFHTSHEYTTLWNVNNGCENWQMIEIDWIDFWGPALTLHVSPQLQLATQSPWSRSKCSKNSDSLGSGPRFNMPLCLRSHCNKSIRNIFVVLFIKK